MVTYFLEDWTAKVSIVPTGNNKEQTEKSEDKIRKYKSFWILNQYDPHKWTYASTLNQLVDNNISSFFSP